MTSLLGSGNKDLLFTMHSENNKIHTDLKDSYDFDVFTYKPKADATLNTSGKPLWFSVGGFVKLAKGEKFKGTFRDKISGTGKHFIGKFMHACFYTSRLLGDNKSKNHNDIAISFELLKISDGEINNMDEIVSNQVTIDEIKKIQYCSVNSKAGKLISTYGSISSVTNDCMSINPNDDSKKSDDSKKTDSERYIISNLVISSDKAMLYGSIEADDLFLTSLVPTKTEPKTATPTKPGEVAVAAAAEPAAAEPAAGEATPAAAPAAAPAATPAEEKTAAEPGANKEQETNGEQKTTEEATIGGRRKKTGRRYKKLKKTKRRATKKKRFNSRRR